MVALYVLCSDEDKQAFEAWHAHDDAEDNFCELDGESFKLKRCWSKYKLHCIQNFCQLSLSFWLLLGGERYRLYCNSTWY